MFKLLLAVSMLLSTTAVVHSSSLTVFERTSQPIGHHEFCKRNPIECRMSFPDGAAPIVLTPEASKALRWLNAEINARILYMTDEDHYGLSEFWAYPDNNIGDCEDYALEKRRLLAMSGISLANLPIAVVRTKGGIGHAVLIVRTDKGDLVLDNATDEIEFWHETGYTFLKMQDPTHTGYWVDIRPK